MFFVAPAAARDVEDALGVCVAAEVALLLLFFMHTIVTGRKPWFSHQTGRYSYPRYLFCLKPLIWGAHTPQILILTRTYKAKLERSSSILAQTHHHVCYALFTVEIGKYLHEFSRIFDPMNRCHDTSRDSFSNIWCSSFIAKVSAEPT